MQYTECIAFISHLSLMTWQLEQFSGRWGKHVWKLIGRVRHQTQACCVHGICWCYPVVNCTKGAVTPYFPNCKISAEGSLLWGFGLVPTKSSRKFSFALGSAARYSFTAFCTCQLSGAFSEVLTVLVLTISVVKHFLQAPVK